MFAALVGEVACCVESSRQVRVGGVAAGRTSTTATSFCLFESSPHHSTYVLYIRGSCSGRLFPEMATTVILVAE